MLKSKLNVIVVNSPTIFGPGDRKLLEVFNAVRKGLTFVPSGRNSVVDVRDLVDALILIMGISLPNQKLIVTGGNYSIHELNTEISKNLGVRAPRFTIPKFFSPLLCSTVLLADRLIKNLPFGYENVFFGFRDRIHSDSRIRDLGYAHKYSLEESISDTITFLQQKKLFK